MRPLQATLPVWIVGACLLLLIAIAYLFSPPGASFAAAPAGVPASQRSATTTEVGPQQTKTLYAANSACSSRVIRTQGEPIYLLFADPVNGDLASTSLAWNVGFLQGASTTAAYDSGLYGCGRMTAESLASTTITTAEFF